MPWLAVSPDYKTLQLMWKVHQGFSSQHQQITLQLLHPQSCQYYEGPLSHNSWMLHCPAIWQEVQEHPYHHQKTSQQFLTWGSHITQHPAASKHSPWIVKYQAQYGLIPALLEAASDTFWNAKHIAPISHLCICTLCSLAYSYALPHCPGETTFCSNVYKLCRGMTIKTHLTW